MPDTGNHGSMITANRPGHMRVDDGWLKFAREAVTIISAAGAAYMGIRVDLGRNQLDIENLKAQQARIEVQLEKVRDANMVLNAGAHK